MTKKKSAPTPNNPPLHNHPDFSEFVTDLAHGTINQRLTEQLSELVEAVEDTQKKGTLSVKFNIKWENKMAIVSVESKTDKPEHPMHGSLFYIGQNGALLREDPRQLTLRNLEQPRLVDLENRDNDNEGTDNE